MTFHPDGTPCAGDIDMGRDRPNRCSWKDDGSYGDHQSYPTLVGALEDGLETATERAITAAEDSVKVATLLLAAGARECLPKAARIYLSESDQGEWLWVDDIDGLAMERDEGFQDSYGHAASCLYLAHLDASPYLHDDGTGNGRYYIDIQEALA